MLDANDPTFQQQYPNGAIVRDRLGRQLRGVVACDPETGEVWTIDKNPRYLTPIELEICRVGRGAKHTAGFIDGSLQFLGECPIRRIDLHPAPLSIEPRRWLHVGFVNH